MRRRKPDSMEIQQMKQQAQDEKKRKHVGEPFSKTIIMLVVSIRLHLSGVGRHHRPTWIFVKWLSFWYNFAMRIINIILANKLYLSKRWSFYFWAFEIASKLSPWSPWLLLTPLGGRFKAVLRSEVLQLFYLFSDLIKFFKSRFCQALKMRVMKPKSICKWVLDFLQERLDGWQTIVVPHIWLL